MRIKLIYTGLVFLLIACVEKNTSKVQKDIAKVNGTELYYEMTGSGEPLVFVHGGLGDRRQWDFQFKPLAKEFKVIRYDLRGHGKSALPEPGATFGNHEDLKALLDHLGIEKVHLCGLSSGSRVITNFALAYPEMCKSIIPVGPSLHDYKTPNADSIDQVFAKMGSIFKEKGGEQAVNYLLTGNKWFKNTIRTDQTREQLKMIMTDHEFWEFKYETDQYEVKPTPIKQLDKIQIPTLIFTAEYDLKYCNEIANIMEKEIPGSRKVSLKGAGHIMNMDKPEEFNDLIVQFIKGLE